MESKHTEAAPALRITTIRAIWSRRDKSTKKKNKIYRLSKVERIFVNSRYQFRKGINEIFCDFIFVR